MKKVPRLRFRGFSEDWELCKLGELIESFDSERIPIDSSLRISGQYPYYGATGIIDYIDSYIFDGEYVLLAEDGANIIMRNYPVAYLTQGKFWLNNHAHIMRMVKGDNQFLVQILEKMNYSKYNTGTAQPKLNSNIVKRINLRVPIPEEQQKIGTIFKQLDDTITLHQRKLDQLKKLKKAYLQAMFVSTNPKNNKVPKLRFTDFEGDWELCKLGVMAPLRGGFAFKSENFQNSGVRIVRISNIDKMGKIRGPYVYCQEQENDTNYLLPNNSVLLAMSGATTGKVAILSKRSKEKYYQNQRVGYFQKNIEYSYDFIAVLVQSDLFLKQLDSVLVSGAQPNISSTEINNFNFMIPKNVEEQNQIGIFIKNIDNTITFHQNKLTQLKSLKKSYLQNMFI
ncbi:restriction endonuclease subunit S [Enterococcus faecalis]|nr:restriction endonuclease subunit S [Enterococcus faecalis]